MTKKEKIEVERLIALKTVSSEDKRSAYLLYKKYIEREALFCLNCDASVRQMFIRLSSWYKSKTVAYTFIREVKPKK